MRTLLLKMSIFSLKTANYSPIWEKKNHFEKKILILEKRRKKSRDFLQCTTPSVLGSQNNLPSSTMFVILSIHRWLYQLLHLNVQTQVIILDINHYVAVSVSQVTPSRAVGKVIDHDGRILAYQTQDGVVYFFLAMQIKLTLGPELS